MMRRGNFAAVTPAATAAATLVKVVGWICSPERIRSKLRGKILPIIFYWLMRRAGANTGTPLV
jgi:hypothetical protein